MFVDKILIFVVQKVLLEERYVCIYVYFNRKNIGNNVKRWFIEKEILIVLIYMGRCIVLFIIREMLIKLF